MTNEDLSVHQWRLIAEAHRQMFGRPMSKGSTATLLEAARMALTNDYTMKPSTQFPEYWKNRRAL